MAPERDHVELLRTPGARVLAFEPSGARSVPLPEALRVHGAVEQDAVTPLDTITTATQGRAVVAFEQARRNGRGSAPVTLLGEVDDHQLHIIDLEAEHGCFIGVLLPIRADAPDAGPGAALPPLRSTYQMDVAGAIEGVSPEFTAMLGWSADEVVGRSSLDIIHPDDHEAGIVAWIELLERPQAATRVRQRFATAEGGWLWCEVTDVNRLGEDPSRVDGELVDISREMATHAALEDRERLLDRLSRALPTGVCHVDADGVVDFCNDRWTELTGLLQADGLTALLRQLSDPATVERAIDQAVANGIDADLDVVVADGSGICTFGALHLRPLREGDVHLGLLVTLDDVTRLRNYQLKLADQAMRDPLTGVANRAGVEHTLSARLIEARRGRADVAVLFLDLDRFKPINDTHGHALGDEVLGLVADQLRAVVRADDHVGRIGGDEFLVVLEAGPTRAAEVAERIRTTIPQVAERVTADIEVSVSVGVALVEPGDDFDSVLRRADEAMYAAKRARYAEWDAASAELDAPADQSSGDRP